MYYDIIDKMDFEEEEEYSTEIVDGQERYRWYNHIINSLDFIGSCDAHHNIDNQDFSELEDWYKGVNWVMENDPEALVHIMSNLTEPVTEIVKEKFLENLQELEYYMACAIIKEHLRTYPVPEERTFIRAKEKMIKNMGRFFSRLDLASSVLYKFKTEHSEMLADKETKDNISGLLNIKSGLKRYTEEEIEAMEWLRINSPESMKEKFKEPVCIEIKDKVIEFMSKFEKFELCEFLTKIIKIHGLPDYYQIPLPKPEIDPELDFLYDEDDYE
ncbi:MAG: hypothetical protein GY756_05380 [bacterium]|nr:hypothetical protein [bacterium]